MNVSASADPYKAPVSETIPAVTGDLAAVYVGPKNAEYYRARFEKFRSTGGRLSWHWPAFFIGSLWLLYRKMWLVALLYWVGLPAASLGAASLVGGFAGPEAGVALYYLLYYGAIFLVFPLFANHLYFRHAQRKVEKVSASFPDEAQRAAELTRIGGTSNIVFVLAPLIIIAVIGILAAIAIPAYQDYTIRSQVALSLAGGARAAVGDFHASHGILPADNEAAGLPAPEQIAGDFVAALAVENGALRLLYGNAAHESIAGRSLLLMPAITADGQLDWRCLPQDIAAKYLPSACRKGSD